jgi:hypothetical protein
MEQNNWPSIWIGPIVWKDLLEKGFLTNRIEDVLNDHIDLSDYGSGIAFIRFMPFIVRPSNKIHEEAIVYSGRKKEISVKLRIDYDAAAQADEDAFRSIIAQRFLDSIAEFPKHKVKHFDWLSLQNDVRKVFEQQGWLMPAEQV